MQNVFANGQYFRIISLNTEYFLLFKQNRDQSQMLALAKQAFPGQVSYFMESYKKPRKILSDIFLSTSTRNRFAIS